jgi:phage terminase large subunit-like protein
MTSALGYTAEHFAAARRTSGERSWYALYQGSPTTLEGGLIKRDWLDDWRLPAAPLHPLKTVVAIDPSDSGEGDKCGLVGASIASDGTVAVIADVSAPMTSDQWARAAVDLAINVGASEIAVEGFAARETYVRVVNDALRRANTPHPIRVTSWPPKGSGRGGGDAMARSSALLQGLEVGTCRIAGHLPDLEDAAVGWQVGQHQPDVLAALVVAHDVLVHSLGQQVVFTNPATIEARMREREAGPFGGRFGRVGPGAATVTPIDARLSRRVPGGGYDPLAAPRKTLRNL